MSIIPPKIIAPDSSHWAKWIDATQADNPDRRAAALGLHGQLIAEGRIPLLSWHHLEELLGGDDDRSARSRVYFIRALPVIAWIRLPKDNVGLGSAVQVLAAEAIAASEGLSDLLSIRDRAKQLLINVGTGSEAIGDEAWVWDAVRPVLRARRPRSDMVAALSPLRTFDENRTIGELAKGTVKSPAEMQAQLDRIYASAFEQARKSTGGDRARATIMANDFVARVIALLPPPGTTVRDLIVSTLVNQGVDAEEVRDDRILADLSRLGVFRSQLRVAAEETGRPFDQLKRIPMTNLPSRVIGDALAAHGQPREKRPGSDVHDAHLAVLAAYCDTLYVDRRTAEDFTRAIRKEPRLTGLIGNIAKAADFTNILASSAC